MCRSQIQGFKLILTAPGESSQLMVHSFRIPLMEQADIMIRPTLIYISEGLRSFKPDKRKCFFISERKLNFFKIYAQYTCELECLTNFTKIECGCLKFNMPSKKKFRFYFNFSKLKFSYILQEIKRQEFAVQEVLNAMKMLKRDYL